MAKIRIVVLISGNGSNLQSLIDARGTTKLPEAEIVHVISDRKGAKGLDRAKSANIPTTYHGIMPYRAKHKDDQTAEREAYDADLAAIITSHLPDLVVCAGFMRILTRVFLKKMNDANLPVINLHPSLPAPNLIQGAGAIERAHQAFQERKISKTGVMIHYVIEEVDTGEPILWHEVEIKESDSVHDLAQRIHETEWLLIVDGTRKAIEDLKNTRKQIVYAEETAT